MCRHVNPEKTTKFSEKKVPASGNNKIRAYSGYTCNAPTFDDVRVLLLSRSQIYPTCDFTFHDGRARGNKIKREKNVKKRRGRGRGRERKTTREESNAVDSEA